MGTEERIITASRVISAGTEDIFELIAEPTNQPRWDGNGNLSTGTPGERVRQVGDVFTMTLTSGAVRQNHVVAFEEGRVIAWKPSEVDQPQPGHLWRWELEPFDTATTRVTHTYDWTELTDPKRVERARATTADNLLASLDRLAAVAEGR